MVNGASHIQKKGEMKMAKVCYIDKDNGIREFNTNNLDACKAHMEKNGIQFTALSLGYKSHVAVWASWTAPEGYWNPDYRGPRPIMINVSMPKQATRDEIEAVLAKEGKFRLLTPEELRLQKERELCACENCGKKFTPPNVDYCLPGNQMLTDYCSKCR